MKHVPASDPGFDRQFFDRRELIEWAEPVIADRVFDRYRIAAGGGGDKLDGLAAQHRKLWRSVLLDQDASVSLSRKELLRLGRMAGLSPSFVDAVDQDIIEELLEIVLSRYQASRTSAKRFSLILMAAAGNIGAARAAA